MKQDIISFDWIDELKQECERTSQNRAAKRLGVSAAQISQVLSGSYPGKADRLEARVRGELMGSVVNCPVVGDLNRRTCADYQELPFAGTSPIRVRLYKTCRGGCPFSSLPRTY